MRWFKDERGKAWPLMTPAKLEAVIEIMRATGRHSLDAGWEDQVRRLCAANGLIMTDGEEI